MKDTFQRTNAKLKNPTRKSEMSKACSLVLSASCSHQKTTTVGAAMASFLTQRDSRFIFSHTSVWCPLKHLLKLVENGKISTRSGSAVTSASIQVLLWTTSIGQATLTNAVFGSFMHAMKLLMSQKITDLL